MKRDGFGWQPPPLPDDPAERRKIGIRLVILAALGVIVQIISPSPPNRGERRRERFGIVHGCPD